MKDTFRYEDKFSQQLRSKEFTKSMYFGLLSCANMKL